MEKISCTAQQLPDGWTIYLPKGRLSMVDNTITPHQYIYQWDGTDFFVCCCAWRFEEDGRDASSTRMHELFRAAAVNADNVLNGVDASQFFPDALSCMAYEGLTHDGVPMLAFVFCTPGHMLTLYLVGDDMRMREILCVCMSRTVHGSAVPIAPSIRGVMRMAPHNKIEPEPEPW